MANRARMETFKANGAVIKKLQWLSTLDTRTSKICQSRDGELYDLGSVHPTPPAHIGCRSVILPITKSWQELGINRKEVTPETRASMDGQVPAKTTYQEWQSRQSK